MSQGNVEIVRGMYDALAEGNVDAVVARLNPKIEWNEAEHFPYADGNPYIGPDAVVQGVFAPLGSEWEYWSLDVDRILDAGDSVVASGRYRSFVVSRPRPEICTPSPPSPLIGILNVP